MRGPLLAATWVLLLCAPRADARSDRGAFAEIVSGGSALLGAAGEGYHTGLRLGVAAGYEYGVAGLGQEVLVAYERWRYAGEPGVRGRQVRLAALPGVRWTHDAGPVGLWLAAHLGYAYVWADATRGAANPVAAGAVGIHGAFGMDLILRRGLGVGISAGVLRAFGREEQGRELTALGVDFGLRLKVKLDP
jgi:hypothetical protein